MSSTSPKGSRHCVIYSRSHENQVLEVSSCSERWFVTINGNVVRLTSSQTELFLLLIRDPDMVITKEVFLDYLYEGSENEPEQKIIDVFICKIRHQLQIFGQFLKGVWGRGYVWETNNTHLAAWEALQQQKRPSVKGFSSDARIYLSDLPKPTEARWVLRRKATVLEAVGNGLLSLEEARTCYRLSTAEFENWQKLWEDYGLAGLRTTRIQDYRQATVARTAE